MDEEKVIITCEKCPTKVRIPVKESLIKFKCNNCGNLNFVLLGSLVPNPEELKINPESEPITKNNEGEQKTKIKIIGSLIFWKTISAVLLLFIIGLLIVLPRLNVGKKAKILF